MRDIDAGKLPISIPGHYNGLASRKWPTNRVERFSAHQQRSAHRQSLEPSQVAGQPPRHCAIVSNDSAGCDSDNGRKGDAEFQGLDLRFKQGIKKAGLDLTIKAGFL